MRPYEDDLRQVLDTINKALSAYDEAEAGEHGDMFWPKQTGWLLGTLKGCQHILETTLKYEPDDDVRMLGLEIQELKEENERLREQLADYRRMERGWGAIGA